MYANHMVTACISECAIPRPETQSHPRLSTPSSDRRVVNRRLQDVHREDEQMRVAPLGPPRRSARLRAPKYRLPANGSAESTRTFSHSSAVVERLAPPPSSGSVVVPQSWTMVK